MFDGESGAGDSENADTTTNAKSDANSGGEQGDGRGEDKVAFSSEQQRHIDKLIGDARKDAARIAADRAKADRDAADADARKQKDADDARKAGDFEKVELQLKTDLEGAKNEVTSLKAENDRLKQAMQTGLDAGWSALPDEVRKIGEKQHPDDDVLGRWEFLHDTDTMALVKKLNLDQRDVKRGNGPDPKGRGESKPTVEQEAAALRQHGGYAM